jgi:hydrogenase maturation protease
LSAKQQPRFRQPDSSLLVFGIGNSGREDDGLGWAFLDRVQQEFNFQARFEYRYQLQIEDAALICSAERVVLVDSFNGQLPGGFRWTRCKARSDFQFTSHVLPPEAVIYLCRQLYSTEPEAYLLAIQGESWKLETGLSNTAQGNLKAALGCFREHVGSWPGFFTKEGQKTGNYSI